TSADGAELFDGAPSALVREDGIHLFGRKDVVSEFHDGLWAAALGGVRILSPCATDEAICMGSLPGGAADEGRRYDSPVGFAPTSTVCVPRSRAAVRTAYGRDQPE
ncbi:hypothetical protein DJ68_14235, partial [Halorubrum sp. C3]